MVGEGTGAPYPMRPSPPPCAVTAPACDTPSQVGG
jgi:hypothetical protein